VIPLGILAAAGGAVAAAGSYDLLATDILTSSSSSITFASLGTYAADYQHLQIRGVVARQSTGDIANAYVKLNGSNATKAHKLNGDGSSVSSAVSTSPRTWNFSGTGDQFTAFVLDVLDFGETTKNKTTRMLSGAAVTEGSIQLTSSFLDSTSAVTSIVIGTDASFQADSRFSLYGIRKAA